MNFKSFSRTLLVAAVGLLVVPACTDLEVEGLDSTIVDAAGGGTGTIDAAAFLESSYSDLGNFTDQANIYSLFEHVSDEMIPPTRGTDWGDNGIWRTLHAHTWDAGHSFILNSWNQLNSNAYKNTRVLSQGTTPAITAETQFLRGFYSWHILDLWGQIPFRDPKLGNDATPIVYSGVEAFNFVEADLVAAEAVLPSVGPGAVNEKASKAAANAMLARLYLNKGVYTGTNAFDAADMDKVIAACDKVTADGYSLEANYFDNFSTNSSTERILTVKPSAGNANNRFYMTTHYDQIYDDYNFGGGWNGMTTLAEFYDKFEAGDSRKGSVPTNDMGRGFLIGQQYLKDGTPILNTRNGKPLEFTRDVTLAGAATEKGIRVIKYHPADAGTYILIRYADVLLMKAEAMFRKGDAAGALGMVNDLRAARGATALADLSEATLLDERGRELYWEGYRRTDQVRFGTFTDTWSSKTVTDPFRVKFPIPQQALDSNPNLKQNDGY